MLIPQREASSPFSYSPGLLAVPGNHKVAPVTNDGLFFLS